MTLAIRDEDNPYRYAEVRRHVAGTEDGDKARAQVDEPSQRYNGGPHPPEQIKSERVSVSIEPKRQTSAG